MMISILRVTVTLKKFSELQKNNILEPHRCGGDFRSSNKSIGIGDNFYVFKIRYQEVCTATQTVQVEAKFSDGVDSGVIGCALVVTNRLVSVSSDGRRHFDLI